MKDKLEQLLDEVFLICKHHKELSTATGEFFNIFSLLGVESAEVTTHSRLLAELLNPKGSHGLHEAFLELFVKQFGLPFDFKIAEAKAEYYIGRKTDTTGGRIDILISANGKLIKIENKIYAGDQEDQLLRYYNFPPKDSPLFYLTLEDGTKPTPVSTGNGVLDEKNYKCISYEKDMLKWLEDCKKEAVNFPLVRETIAQYINLIKDLTNQNRSNKMNNEIVEAVLKESDRLTAFFDLIKAKGPILAKICEKLKSDVEEIANGFPEMELYFCGEDGVPRFDFKNPTMDKCGVHISFTIEGGLMFGFKYKDDESKKMKLAPRELLTKFKEVYGDGKQSDWWPCYAYWNERKIWSGETYREIYFDKSRKLKSEIKEKVTRMLEIFESANRAA